MLLILTTFVHGYVVLCKGSPFHIKTFYLIREVMPSSLSLTEDQAQGVYLMELNCLKSLGNLKLYEQMKICNGFRLRILNLKLECEEW
jgi:hypothetical protein